MCDQSEAGDFARISRAQIRDYTGAHDRCRAIDSFRWKSNAMYVYARITTYDKLSVSVAFYTHQSRRNPTASNDVHRRIPSLYPVSHRSETWTLSVFVLLCGTSLTAIHCAKIL